MASPLKVVYRDTAKLAPYERNARTHSAEQVEAIRRSIREFGFTNPILLRDDGVTIGAGHGRWEAAKLEGLDRVPTITLAGLSEAQWRAYVLADNRIALDAGWDEEMLKAELGELRDLGVDLGLTGFSDLDLADIMADRTSGMTDPDDVPDAPAVPVSALGDVWLLGSHRLVCGDCTVAETAALAMGGGQPASHGH